MDHIIQRLTSYSTRYFAGRAWMIAPCVALSGLLGCARVTPHPQMRALEQRLSELVQRDAENNRRIDDLNTRLFLLEDKLDRRAEGASTSRSDYPRAEDDVEHLPVVRLKPQHIPSPPAARLLSTASEENGVNAPERAAADASTERVEVPRAGAENTESLVAAHDVAYGGAALRAGPRPVLRLRGERRLASIGRVSDIDTSFERLPVVPLASKRVAEALASAAPRAQRDEAVAAYRSALMLYRERRLPEAVGAFRRVIQQHPHHEYIDNAMYWLAECFYDLKQYPAAVELFKRVVTEHPQGNKVPDALLKVGYSYLRLRELAKGRAVLQQVSSKYGDSSVGKLATATLSELGAHSTAVRTDPPSHPSND